jgi:hypothetical protein
MKNWFVNDYKALAGLIVRTSDEVQPIHDWFKAASKWWLDLVRNILVACGLLAIAIKSESKVLWLFSGVTLVALVCFIMVEANRYEIRLPDGVTSPKITRAASQVFTLLVTLWLSSWILRAILTLVDTLPMPGGK